MLKDLIKVKDRVEHILIKYPSTRDSDKELFLAYSCLFCNLKDSLDGNYATYKKWFLEKMPEIESIRRCRQKHQENNPTLRGKKYKHRKVEADLVKDWTKKG